MRAISSKILLTLTVLGMAFSIGVTTAFADVLISNTVSGNAELRS